MLNRTATIFDDLEDPSIFLQAPTAEARAAETTEAVEKAATLGHWESCPKCGGTGQFRGYTGRTFGQCFACKGKGGHTYKQTYAQRQNAKAQREDREERKRVERSEAFKAEHPAEWAWIVDAAGNDRSHEFGVSLLDGIMKYGSLTEKQLAAVRRNIVRRGEAIEAAKVRAESAPTVSVEMIEAAFATGATIARKRNPNGRLKTLTLRLATTTILADGKEILKHAFVFSPAGANSKNPGAIYVKEGEQYLGKIVGGKFLATRECGDERRDEVVKAASDPRQNAIAYGKMVGCCSVCGAELTNQVSIERGIGPVCAEKYGW